MAILHGNCFVIATDRFWFDTNSAQKTQPTSDVKITSDGVITWGSATQAFPKFDGVVSSFACDGRTLVLTLSTSHLLFLIARGNHDG